jgi:FixJ family two-component response regulator
MTQKRPPTVFLIDDSADVRESLTWLIGMSGFAVEAFSSAEAFLEAYSEEGPTCLILDLKMPGMSGTELQAELARRGIDVPIVFLTAYGDIPATVRAIRAGAVDFLTKPVEIPVLLDRIQAILAQEAQRHARKRAEREVAAGLATLTPREAEVASLLVTGRSNKEIARKLGISHRTVEAHRARVMDKTRAANLIQLASLFAYRSESDGSVR